ncbi:hypothetical protein KKF97_04725 [Myxococcota bacterium]|nr:hypothetical protein [Myxococcota bacterium]
MTFLTLLFLNFSCTEKPPGKQEAGNPGAGKQEAGNPGAGKQEAGNPGAGNPGTGKQEAGKQEAGKQEAGKQEAGKQEAGKQEAGKQEAGNPGAGNPGTGKQEAGKQEAGNPGTGKKEDISVIIGDINKKLPESVYNDLSTITGKFPRVYPRKHRYFSKETEHNVWFSIIKDRGGVYIGTMTDENYTLATKSLSSLFFLIDNDTAILNLHRLYLFLVDMAHNQDEFFELFEPNYRKRIGALISEKYPENDAKFITYILKNEGRSIVNYHRKRLACVRKKKCGEYWLSSPELFSRLKKMVYYKRVFLIKGNFPVADGLIEIAEKMQKYNLTAGVIFLSDIETKFGNSDVFAKNIRKIPHSSNTLILRTVRGIGNAKSDGFSYLSQNLKNYVEYKTAGESKDPESMISKGKKNGIVIH